MGGFGWNKSSVPVTAAELVEAAVAGEDEEADIDVAEDREFAGFLHETAASLRLWKRPEKLPITKTLTSSGRGSKRESATGMKRRRDAQFRGYVGEDKRLGLSCAVRSDG
ncbi:hypothetical protein RHGRI_031165 [Rhododendron griersonianum]|uniref:Uncharacterized protein n=1 Tax=Rhododendron griersonianum TaxID=479676 RepID=A0AAV6ICM7_9ERIC|nr:hypothetical protein RHGRI_031165 [Rhododendron griersonianum]